MNDNIHFFTVICDSKLRKQLKLDMLKSATLKSAMRLFQIYLDHTGDISNRSFEYETLTSTLTEVNKRLHSTNHSSAMDWSEFDSVYGQDLSNTDSTWLENNAMMWLKVTKFKTGLGDMITYVKTQEFTATNADSIIKNAIDIFSSGRLSIGKTTGIDFNDISSHSFTDYPTFTSGKKFVDNFLGGGVRNGTLSIYLGQQNIGKSLWMVNDAVKFIRSGYNVMYCSFEMSVQSVLKRAGSILLDVPMSEYEEFTKDRAKLQRAMDNLNGMTSVGQLHIAQFTGADVLELTSYVRRYEETNNIKIHYVVVDYLGLMTDYRTSGDVSSYFKLKNISMDLRNECVNNSWIGISAMQIGKTGWDSDTITTRDISESAAVLHNVDNAWGIIQTPDMYADSTYWLKNLKIRDGKGKNTKCKFYVDSDTLELEETYDLMLEDN